MGCMLLLYAICEERRIKNGNSMSVMILYVLTLSILTITQTTALICTREKFTCTSGQCVPAVQRCDNSFDCTDYSDELNCGGGIVPCPEGLYRCINLECVVSNARCNNITECEDGSDEDGCNIMQQSISSMISVVTSIGGQPSLMTSETIQTTTVLSSTEFLSKAPVTTRLNEFSTTGLIPSVVDTSSLVSTGLYPSMSAFSLDTQESYKPSQQYITASLSYSSFSSAEQPSFLPSVYVQTLQSVSSSDIGSTYPYSAIDQSPPQINLTESENPILTATPILVKSTTFEVVTHSQVLTTLQTSLTVNSSLVTKSVDMFSTKISSEVSVLPSEVHSLSEESLWYKTSTVTLGETITDYQNNYSTKGSSIFSVFPSENSLNEAVSELRTTTAFYNFSVTDSLIDNITKKMTSYQHLSLTSAINGTMSDSLSLLLPTTSLSLMQKEISSVSKTDKLSSQLLEWSTFTSIPKTTVISEFASGYETSTILSSMTSYVVDNPSLKVTLVNSVLPSDIYTSSDAATNRAMLTSFVSSTVTEFSVDRSTQRLTSYQYSLKPSTIIGKMSDSSSTVLSVLPTTAPSFNENSFSLVSTGLHPSISAFSLDTQKSNKQSQQDITASLSYSSFLSAEQTSFLPSIYEQTLQSISSSDIGSIYPYSAIHQPTPKIINFTESVNSNFTPISETSTTSEVVTHSELLTIFSTSLTVHSFLFANSVDIFSTKIPSEVLVMPSKVHSLSEESLWYTSSTVTHGKTITDFQDSPSTKGTSIFSVFPSENSLNGADSQLRTTTAFHNFSVMDSLIDNITQKMTSYQHLSLTSEIIGTLKWSTITTISIRISEIASENLITEEYSSVLATSESILEVSIISTTPTVNITASNQISNDTSYMVVIVPFVITVLVILIGFGSLIYRYKQRIGARNNYQPNMLNEEYSTDSLYRGWPLSCRCATRNHRGKWIPLQDSYHWN